MIRLKICFIPLIYVLLSFTSCSTIEMSYRTHDKTKLTRINGLEYIISQSVPCIIDGETFPDLSSYTATGSLQEARRNTCIYKEILLFKKWVIVEWKIRLSNDFTRDFYKRNIQSAVYNYKTGLMIKDVNEIKELIALLVKEIQAPTDKYKIFGIEYMSSVITSIFFHHMDSLMDESKYLSPTARPHLSIISHETYTYEFYIQEPWTMYSSPYTYCKLTVTPDKIEFETHDVKLDGKITDADGNIIEEGK